MSIICSIKDIKDHKAEVCDEGHAAALSAGAPLRSTPGYHIFCRSGFQIPDSKAGRQLQKAVELFGAAGEFCCHSLGRSQISKDL